MDSLGLISVLTNFYWLIKKKKNSINVSMGWSRGGSNPRRNTFLFKILKIFWTVTKLQTKYRNLPPDKLYLRCFITNYNYGYLNRLVLVIKIKEKMAGFGLEPGIFGPHRPMLYRLILEKFSKNVYPCLK